MKPNYNRKDFVNALFDDNETTGFGSTTNEVCRSKSKNELINDTTSMFFSVNPFHTWKEGKNMKITSLLFEVDEDLEPREQVKLFLSSGIPFTTMTFSGGGSIHCIIRFTKSFENTRWSYAWWFAIAKVLKQYGIVPDKQARLATQISRVPDVIRVNTNRKQTGIYVKDRVDHQEMLEWIQKHGVEIEIPKPIKTKPYIPDSNSTISDKEKWTSAYNMYKSVHGEYDVNLASGNWMNLIYFATYCYKVDLDLNACISISQSNWGTTFLSSRGGGNIDEGITEGYKWSEGKQMHKIKLNTKEEYKTIRYNNALKRMLKRETE